MPDTKAPTRMNERVAQFRDFKDSVAWETYLRQAFLEVARDQRHACALAISQIVSSDGGLIRKNAAHQAVMNAPLGGE